MTSYATDNTDNTDDTGDSGAPLYCANHPTTQTYLRCAKCEKPICAKCRVSTPVGFRCYDCARLQSLPTYALDSGVYVKAGIVGLIVAGAAGVLMGLLPSFEFWAALLMGIAVPEAVSIAANQKRGPGLQWVGMASIAFGFIVSRLVLLRLPDLITLGGVNFFRGSEIEFFNNLPFPITQYTILWLALALFFTYKRLQ